MPQNTLIIAIVIGIVIALLAVALYLLTRKGGNQTQSEPLVKRNPDYGPRSEDNKAKPKPAATTAAGTVEKPAPAKEAASVASPLKPRAVEAEPKKAAEAKAPEAKKPVEQKPEEKKPEPVAKKEPAPIAKKPDPVVEDDDGWGDDDAWEIESSADIDAIGETSLEDDFSAGVKKQQDDSAAKPKKIVDRKSSEDDEDDWGDDVTEGQQEFDDGWTGPVLTRVSPEIKQAFKEESLTQEFHVSKRKEADELIVKCVQAYLKDNTDSEVKAARERVYALHAKIQSSDLPEIIESFVDSGDEVNQKYFADFEDMCNTHQDSVLVLFEKFNTTLPLHLRSRRIAEMSDPMPAVLYLAPEWEDDDFDRPDFDERDEDIDENVDYLEDFYDQLEDDDEEKSADADKKQA